MFQAWVVKHRMPLKRTKLLWEAFLEDPIRYGSGICSANMSVSGGVEPVMLSAESKINMCVA